MSDSVWPHRRQPTRLPRPWDSPGKNTGVGCHFLLQCMKVKSESGVAQSCLTLSDPMDCSLTGSSVHGIFQARVLEWGAIAFSGWAELYLSKSRSLFSSWVTSSDSFYKFCFCIMGTKDGHIHPSLQGEIFQFSSVAQLCPNLCDRMDCSTPGLPVYHQLSEFTQTHLHWVGNAIQPFHPLSPLLLTPSIYPSIRVFSKESVLCIRWPKYWSFSFSISASNEYSGLISFRIDWFDLLAV